MDVQAAAGGKAGIPDVITVSDDQKLYIQQLGRLIPGLASEDPEVWQRIFDLGIFSLTMQVIARFLGSHRDASARNLLVAARKTLGASWFNIGTLPDGIDSMIPLIAVTGFCNSGKTTAIEFMVSELCRRNYRVGTCKHCHHGYDLDRPGKDSWRHRQAGAARTVLTGPGGFALLSEPLPEEDLGCMADWLFLDMDLVLVEGYHWLPLPRIEIQRSDGVTRSGHPDGKRLGVLPCGFGAAEIAEICDLLEQRYFS